ncbi:acyl-CoA dehydrogenase family protein [Nocardioides sp. YIM B13467]|uniref:acyl-CoA dehydrogenase family protein n=1 Tax=Nocardioides sp. YIM B13467 TaxID=3366294 RepID=UPI00366F218F
MTRPSPGAGLDGGAAFPEPEAAMAKLRGAALAVPVEAIYRDSKIGEIYEGANEVHQWVIARQIRGRELTG